MFINAYHSKSLFKCRRLTFILQLCDFEGQINFSYLVMNLIKVPLTLIHVARLKKKTVTV